MGIRLRNDLNHSKWRIPNSIMQELFIILHGEFPILTDDFLVMFSINQSCRMESPQSNPSFLKNAAHHSLLPGAALAPPSALLPPRKATPPRAVWGNNNCSHPFLSSDDPSLPAETCLLHHVFTLPGHFPRSGSAWAAGRTTPQWCRWVGSLKTPIREKISRRF